MSSSSSPPSPPSLVLLIPTTHDPGPTPVASPVLTSTSPITSPTSSPLRPPKPRPQDSTPSPGPAPAQPTDPFAVGLAYFNLPVRFQLLHPQLVLSGYQVYAVERYLTDRSHWPTTTITVSTSNPAHLASFTAVTPVLTLPLSDRQKEFDTVVNALRSKDGGVVRPFKDPTGNGTVLVTSLPRFRSDWTIVLLPEEGLGKVRSGLYANIALGRMGCAGRKVVGLEESRCVNFFLFHPHISMID